MLILSLLSSLERSWLLTKFREVYGEHINPKPKDVVRVIGGGNPFQATASPNLEELQMSFVKCVLYLPHNIPGFSTIQCECGRTDCIRKNGAIWDGIRCTYDMGCMTYLLPLDYRCCHCRRKYTNFHPHIDQQLRSRGYGHAVGALPCIITPRGGIARQVMETIEALITEGNPGTAVSLPSC